MQRAAGERDVRTEERKDVDMSKQHWTMLKTMRDELRANEDVFNACMADLESNKSLVGSAYGHAK